MFQMFEYWDSGNEVEISEAFCSEAFCSEATLLYMNNRRSVTEAQYCVYSTVLTFKEDFGIFRVIIRVYQEWCICQ